MARKPLPADPAKRIWRITQAAPQGEYVDRGNPSARPAPIAQPEVVIHGGWIESSFDLLNGVDVLEGPQALSPDEFDTLFGDDLDDDGPWKDTQSQL